MKDLSKKINTVNFEASDPITKVLAKETSIFPRFYTTNLRKMSKIDTSVCQEAFNTVIGELKNDHSKKKFIRNEEFNQSWDQIPGEVRNLIIELLERFCASEYSGFILYKELSHQLKETNSILSDGFSLMSRDEARHAGFLNQAFLDFHIKPCLDFLKKGRRKYTFLPFSWFIYTTYLSERISSCYYITVFEHLEAYPEYSIYPLFKFYKAWSEDENRHGDFLAAIIKSQSQLSDGLKARLSCKFFLLLSFSTMYFKYKDHTEFYMLLGLDAREYSILVIKKLNKTIKKDLPTTLDVENPYFFQKLDNCILHIAENERINVSSQHKLFHIIRKIPHYFSLLLIFLSLFCMKSNNTTVENGLGLEDAD
jgi:magnesium-protoporphyrin IX monomethyl ester (oxidative) cyclase